MKTTKNIDYALMLIKANQLEGARDLLEEIRLIDPRDQFVLYNLGLCHSELGDFEKAIKILSECVNVSPRYSNAYVALGYAHSRLLNNELAKENFRKALEIDPENSYALRNLGGLYGKENDHDNAVMYLEKEFLINSKDQKTAYGLGHGYFHKGELDQADKYFGLVIEINESPDLTAAAKDMKGRIAQINQKPTPFKLDAMFYCLCALQFFKDKTQEEIQEVTFEIGLKGQQGLDINDPGEKYSLQTMDGSFSGLELVSFMYVGFKMIKPEMNIGMDLAQEYKMALELFEKEGPHGYTIH